MGRVALGQVSAEIGAMKRERGNTMRITSFFITGLVVVNETVTYDEQR